MAGVIRFRMQGLARQFIRSSITNPRYIQNSIIMGFHRSSFLNVKGQKIKMPSLSPTMSEGTIVKWLKKEGDVLAPGDVLCDIQTDKAVISLEVEEEGILAKILVSENTPDVKVGATIALTVEEGEDWKSVEMPDDEPAAIPVATAPAAAARGTCVPCVAAARARATAARAIAPAAATAPEAATAPSRIVPAALPVPFPGASFHTATLKSFGPAVKYLLMKYEVNPDSVTPTGNRSKLLKLDVLKYIQEHKIPERKAERVAAPSRAAAASKAATPSRAAAPGVSMVSQMPSPTLPGPELPFRRPRPRSKKTSFVDLEISAMRRTIAKRLLESKLNIPHSYATMSCVIDKLLALRKQLKEDGIGVSVNDFVVKAAAQALSWSPEVNAIYQQDKLVPLPKVDISIAVATDKGLITPIVKDAARKGITEISAEIRDLAIKAREGKLQPHEFQGGSFTISNLGMFGVKAFSAIINPPQVGILAVGAGQSVLDKEAKPTTTMCVTLSYDRRAFDEATAAEFLQVFRIMMEDPTMILLGGAYQKRE